MRILKLRAGVFPSVLLATALILALEMVAFPSQEPAKGSHSVIFAVRVNISHDFSTCVLRFANEGNVTDTTRSVMVFYTEAVTGQPITKNAEPPPDLTLAPGATADWNCMASFAGIPPGVEGEAVNVVVSAVVSRERATSGSFT